MCWLSKNIPIKCIAEEDIHVRKVLYVATDGVITSPVQGATKWKLGVLYSTWLQESPGRSSFTGTYTLWKGFHSCKDIAKTGIFWINPISGEILFGRDEADRIYDAIIPKGASYYESENGEYISSQLIIVKPL